MNEMHGNRAIYIISESVEDYRPSINFTHPTDDVNQQIFITVLTT